MFPLLDELMGMTAVFVMTFYKKSGMIIVVEVLLKLNAIEYVTTGV